MLFMNPDLITQVLYGDTKWYQSTPSFGIVGIDYETVDDFGSHFQLISIKLAA